MNWNQWLYWANLQLKNSTFSRREAEIILEKITNKNRVQLLTYGDTLLDQHTIIKLKSLISRRIKGEPIAYLIGEKEFWSLKLKISSGVFIPRPDTECLVEHTLNLLSVPHYAKVLDLGTGIGTIALALASEHPYWNITGIDIQKKALYFAHQNRKFFNFKNVKFTYGYWFKYLKKEKFHLIVSNPPYVDIHDSCLLNKNIMFEPKKSLISDNAGLLDLTIICYNSIKHLYSNGWIILEHGWKQGQYMRKLLHKLGFTNIHTARDYHNYERVTYGQKNDDTIN